MESLAAWEPSYMYLIERPHIFPSYHLDGFIKSLLVGLDVARVTKLGPHKHHPQEDTAHPEGQVKIPVLLQRYWHHLGGAR